MKGWIIASVVGIVLLLTIVQAVQISSLKGKLSGATVSGGGALDMSGWTADEKMQYEHHGTLPARLSSGASQAKSAPAVQSAPQMVGGC